VGELVLIVELAVEDVPVVDVDLVFCGLPLART
jgi:hypothetical protein